MTDAPQTQSRSRWKPAVTLAIKAVVSIALLAYLLHVQIDNVDDIWTAMGQANPALLVLAFSLNVFGYLLCSWRWQILLAAQSFRVPLVELIRAYTIGIFFNSFLPGMMSGDFMRALDISNRVPSYTRSFLILFVERLTGMFGLLVLAIIALPLVGWDIVGHTGVIWVLAGVAALLLLACLGLVFMRRGSFGTLAETKPWLPGARKIAQISENIADTSRVFARRMGSVYACMAISLVFQANVVLHYYLIGLAVGIDLPPQVYFGIIPIALFVMMVPASVNGIGIREQIFLFLFGAFGAAPALAVSLAWIALAMQLLQAVIGGLLFAVRKRKHSTLPATETWTG